jgi:hypothetical protein
MTGGIELDDEYEYLYLTDCTCEHEFHQHDWDSCVVDGCNCKGHYEE